MNARSNVISLVLASPKPNLLKDAHRMGFLEGEVDGYRSGFRSGLFIGTVAGWLGGAALIALMVRLG